MDLVYFDGKRHKLATNFEILHRAADCILLAIEYLWFRISNIREAIIVNFPAYCHRQAIQILEKTHETKTKHTTFLSTSRQLSIAQ